MWKEKNLKHFGYQIGLLLPLLGTFSLACAHHLASYSPMGGAVKTSEVNIKSFDGTMLSGTLTVPAEGNPAGIVIPVHGSFVQTRDGSLDGSKKWMFPDGVAERNLFRDMTTELSTIDWGTYRYDKRASGKSGGEYAETDMVVLAKDLKAVFEAIRKKFPNTPIGIAGQSEGALTTLRACNLGAQPDFIVLQGPALEPFDITLEFQRIHGAAPFLAEDLKGPLAKKYPYLAAFYHALFFEDMLEKMREGKEKYYDLDWNGYRYRTNLKKYSEYLWSGLELLKEVKAPALVVIGEKDGNVRPEAARYIQRQKRTNAYPNVSVTILDGLEHSFREVDDGDTFIDAMAKPLSPRYAKVLKEFLPTTRRRVKMPGGTP